MTERMTVREAASAMGVSIRRVLTLIAENRLPGSAKNEYGFWLIPTASVRARNSASANMEHSGSEREVSGDKQ